MGIYIIRGLSAAFLPRKVDADKRSVGVVTVIGGSKNYVHAPVIVAMGARAGGGGLIQLVAPQASLAAAGAHVLESTFVELAKDVIFPKADVTVIGSGLGTSSAAEALVKRLLSSRNGGRYVLDADALNVIARMRNGEKFVRAATKNCEIIFTPHEGEAARLLGVARDKVKGNRLRAARDIAIRYGATVVLKGPGTIVVSNDGKRIYRNRTGNPYMALGGMGDLLSGVIGARWAYLRDDALFAAAGSVYLHGLAADTLVESNSDITLTAVAAEISSLRLKLDRTKMEGTWSTMQD